MSRTGGVGGGVFVWRGSGSVSLSEGRRVCGVGDVPLLEELGVDGRREVCAGGLPVAVVVPPSDVVVAPRPPSLDADCVCFLVGV